ncbi:hypothetical protein GMJLKIPL_6175 [Methylobacterium isbiliense]|jgi:hypothetical protein|uniref:Uncharacterized protein n=1 Tax=Methylobacterium isbiliense TaxID=315478 RepID=A0ABQ4SLW8_9HYPH|nr:hypothetical protein GMJLKIPL_6175 [Methylobacterium isbiliense]
MGTAMMTGAMADMGGMMGGMALIALLAFVFLALAIAALLKYLLQL